MSIEEGAVHDQSNPERLRSLFLQVALVTLVVLGCIMLFDAVSEATAPAADGMESEG